MGSADPKSRQHKSNTRQSQGCTLSLKIYKIEGYSFENNELFYGYHKFGLIYLENFCSFLFVNFNYKKL